MSDEIMVATKTIPSKTIAIKNFYSLLVFLLITISLLIIVSIYCYLIKYQSKQDHLLPYYVINNKLKGILY